MRGRWPYQGRNPDVEVRELERRAAAGDGQAAVALLQLRARSGQLPTLPEVNTTVAYHAPEGPPFNEWAGGTNEWEFVDSALQGGARMREQGGSPYMIVTEHGDFHFPAGYGSSLSQDVAWLRGIYGALTRATSGSFLKRKIKERRGAILDLMIRSGISEPTAREALQHLVDYPELVVEYTDKPVADLSVQDFAAIAGRNYMGLLEAAVDALEIGAV